jgi:hypothetical protein
MQWQLAICAFQVLGALRGSDFEHLARAIPDPDYPWVVVAFDGF